LYMMMARARDVDTWRWLANDGSKPSQQTDEPEPKRPQGASLVAKPESKPRSTAAAAKSGPKPQSALPDAKPEPKSPSVSPAATPEPEIAGPTDEDSDEREEASKEFQVMVDGGMTLQREEMVPYNRMVEWVKNQPFERLYHRAKKNLWYTHLHDQPERYRGALVAMNVDVRRAMDAGENEYGINLHEVWAATNESRGRLYDLIIVDYPKKMPVGDFIREKAKFAGYFLKLQGYEPASAKPGQAPDKAPLLIGRLDWEQVVAPVVDNTQEWVWGSVALGAICLVLVVRFVYYKLVRRQPTAARSLISSPSPGDVIPIDVWLERSSLDVDEESSGDKKD
jgi:hypothetical protein